jgi:type IV pilus biogenesis protein CpaD/CtpE
VNFVRTVGSVHIVIIPSITQFQPVKNLTVQAATVLLYCCTADTGDRQQTVSDNFKVAHPVVIISY